MFTAALFTGIKTGKQPGPFHRWQDKEDVVTDTMEYHPATRKDEILPLVTTWIVLENIMLRQISQAEKAKNHMISLISGI